MSFVLLQHLLAQPDTLEAETFFYFTFSKTFSLFSLVLDYLVLKMDRAAQLFQAFSENGFLLLLLTVLVIVLRHGTKQTAPVLCKSPRVH